MATSMGGEGEVKGSLVPMKSNRYDLSSHLMLSQNRVPLTQNPAGQENKDGAEGLWLVILKC